MKSFLYVFLAVLGMIIPALGGQALMLDLATFEWTENWAFEHEMDEVSYDLFIEFQPGNETPVQVWAISSDEDDCSSFNESVARTQVIPLSRFCEWDISVKGDVPTRLTDLRTKQEWESQESNASWAGSILGFLLGAAGVGVVVLRELSKKDT